MCVARGMMRRYCRVRIITFFFYPKNEWLNGMK